MMLLTNVLVFLKTFTLGPRWYCHCACGVRKACEYVCLTVRLPTRMLWLLFQAYHPECKHHVTHDHAKQKQKPRKHTGRPLGFLKPVHAALPVLIKIKKPQQQGRKDLCFWKYHSTRGIYMLFPQVALEILSSPFFLNLNCHLKSTFIFLMLPWDLVDFSVSLESSDILVTLYI